QVKVGKIEDISPAACDLAIGNFERSIWDCFDQARNCLRIEDAVTKVAEDNGVAGRLMNMLADLLQGATGNAAIVERIDLKQAIPAGDKGILIRRLPRAVDNGIDLDASLLQIGQREILERIV